MIIFHKLYFFRSSSTSPAYCFHCRKKAFPNSSTAPGQDIVGVQLQLNLNNSSRNLMFGFPLFLLLPYGVHSVVLFVHLLSFVHIMWPVQFHFNFLIISLSLVCFLTHFAVFFIFPCNTKDFSLWSLSCSKFNYLFFLLNSMFLRHMLV